LDAPADEEESAEDPSEDPESFAPDAAAPAEPLTDDVDSALQPSGPSTYAPRASAAYVHGGCHDCQPCATSCCQSCCKKPRLLTRLLSMFRSKRGSCCNDCCQTQSSCTVSGCHTGYSGGYHTGHSSAGATQYSLPAAGQTETEDETAPYYDDAE
jgi:hypothetical protein